MKKSATAEHSLARNAPLSKAQRWLVALTVLSLLLLCPQAIKGISFEYYKQFGGEVVIESTNPLLSHDAPYGYELLICVDENANTGLRVALWRYNNGIWETATKERIYPHAATLVEEGISSWSFKVLNEKTRKFELEVTKKVTLHMAPKIAWQFQTTREGRLKLINWEYRYHKGKRPMAIGGAFSNH